MLVQQMKKEELKLIQDMSMRVKTLEAHLAQVQAEKEDIAARLHGAENVRDFLMEKLKELEDALSATLEDNVQRDDQAAIDREIIGFLDARNHEYEVTLRQCAEQNEELRGELQRAKQEHMAKVQVVQDMVHLLTQEKNELDMQLRSQRKVLVREVKALRSQNFHLSEERNHYLMQLKQLKHALHHLENLT